MNKKSTSRRNAAAKATLLLLATALPAPFVQAAAAPEVSIVQQQGSVTGTVIDETSLDGTCWRNNSDVHSVIIIVWLQRGASPPSRA